MTLTRCRPATLGSAAIAGASDPQSLTVVALAVPNQTVHAAGAITVAC
jgi:hypothetical protein